MSIEEEYFNQNGSQRTLTQSETHTVNVNFDINDDQNNEINTQRLENLNIIDVESNCESIEYQELYQESDKENEEFYESNESQDDVFYFKYEFEGCKTIDDILCNLDRLKDIFQNMRNDGYRLREDVNSGYCFLYKEQ
jgi:hypothetical protein